MYEEPRQRGATGREEAGGGRGWRSESLASLSENLDRQRRGLLGRAFWWEENERNSFGVATQRFRQTMGGPRLKGGSDESESSSGSYVSPNATQAPNVSGMSAAPLSVALAFYFLGRFFSPADTCPLCRGGGNKYFVTAPIPGSTQASGGWQWPSVRSQQSIRIIIDNKSIFIKGKRGINELNATYVPSISRCKSIIQ